MQMIRIDSYNQCISCLIFFFFLLLSSSNKQSNRDDNTRWLAGWKRRETRQRTWRQLSTTDRSSSSRFPWWTSKFILAVYNVSVSLCCVYKTKKIKRKPNYRAAAEVRKCTGEFSSLDWHARCGWIPPSRPITCHYCWTGGFTIRSIHLVT